MTENYKYLHVYLGTTPERKDSLQQQADHYAEGNLSKFIQMLADGELKVVVVPKPKPTTAEALAKAVAAVDDPAVQEVLKQLADQQARKTKRIQAQE